MYEVSVIAGCSALFYGGLALISACYYWKFRRIQLESPSKDTYYHSKFGRYDTPKVSFFLILTISALMDVPLYIGCLIEGGPHDCEWDSLSYAIGWFLHLIAVCGYAYTIMIPCILWNDIIRNKDGKLFQSQFQADHTKRFFQIALILYVLNTAIDTINAMVAYRVHDHNHYTDTNVIDDVLTFTEPLLIFSITVGCFWCGLRLQSYVMRAKLGWKTELKFLLHLNIPMLVIMCTYLTRALFVLRLVTFMPISYKNGMSSSYLVWIIVTRWLPYIFCSMVLVLMMRFSGAEVAEKHSKANSLHTTSPGRGAGNRFLHRSDMMKEGLLENEHLMGTGTYGRGSEDLSPLGGGRDITVAKKKLQQQQQQQQRSATTSVNTANQTIISSLSSGSTSTNLQPSSTLYSSRTGGSTRNLLHSYRLPSIATGTDTSSHSGSTNTGGGRSISESAATLNSGSMASNVNGIPVVPAMSSSLDRSYSSHHHLHHSHSHSRSKLSKLTLLPSLYDDEPRSESGQSDSIDVLSGGNSPFMSPDDRRRGGDEDDNDSEQQVVSPPPAITTAGGYRDRGAVVGVGGGRGGEKQNTQESRSVYGHSYEDPAAIAAGGSGAGAGAGGSGFGVPNNLQNPQSNRQHSRTRTRSQGQGRSQHPTDYDEEGHRNRVALGLEEPHLLLAGNDDEYYSTSGYGYEETQSSLESMGTREFSVEYFLHQTMFLNLARSYNSSTGGLSPPMFSTDETQPFV